MAPNVVTLSGFGFIILNVLTVLFLNPTLDQEQPRWAYLSYALGLFLYQTFDACDGIHARRTGQSGPLGELFDHSIDSLNTTMSMYVFCSVANVGYDFMLIICQFALMCNFYLSTWEEYHTHKLFLSEFSGPVEGILLVIASFVVTAIYGSKAIWHKQLAEVELLNMIFKIETVHIVFMFSGIGLIFNILSARRNVIQHYSENSKSKKEATTLSRRADKELLPFFVYFFTVFISTIVQPKFISLPYIFSVGLTMAFTVGRIIIAHLTQQSFPMNNPPMYIPAVQLSLFAFFVYGLNHNADEVTHILNWFGFGLTLGIHGMFITEIIYDFTTYLDIYALSIKHPKKIE